MDNRIAELTKSIYNEGVEKAREESRRIILEAEQKAASLLAKAKQDADALLADAARKADESKKNTDAEIKLSCQQAMAGLKNAITDLVSAKTVDKPVKTLLSDPAILKDFLVQILKNWKSSTGLAAGIEVLLPEASRKEMEKAFQSAVQESATQGVEVKFTDTFQAGFQIAPKGATYKISMTDADFAEFFKSYLRPRTREFLFGKS
jgi:V/A-type H+-transporting ATPase subunit E